MVSLAWSRVAFAASDAFADAVRRRLRTRVEEGRDGLWKRVIMSRVLCCLLNISSVVPRKCTGIGLRHERGRVGIQF